MEHLFDLDKLHKKQRRQRIRNIAIACLVVAVFVVGGVAALSSKKTPNHLATVNGNFTASQTSSSSSGGTKLDTQSSSSASSLSTDAAQEKALAAQDEANAKQDAKNAESLGSSLDTTAPTLSSSSTPTYSTTSPSTPTYTAPSCPELGTYEQQLTNAQNKLNTDQTYANEGVNPGLYGATGTEIQSYWNNQVSQDQQAVNTAQQQLNNYKQQNSGC